MHKSHTQFSIITSVSLGFCRNPPNPVNNTKSFDFKEPWCFFREFTYDNSSSPAKTIVTIAYKADVCGIPLCTSKDRTCFTGNGYDYIGIHNQVDKDTQYSRFCDSWPLPGSIMAGGVTIPGFGQKIDVGFLFICRFRLC